MEKRCKKGSAKCIWTSLSALLLISSATFLLNSDLSIEPEITSLAIFMSSEPATLTVNFSDEIGAVRGDFYGVNVHGIWGSNLSWIDVNDDGTLETESNYTWHREKLLNANLNYLRADMGLNYVSTSEGVFNSVTNFDNYANINTRKNIVAWAKENDVKILFVASYMPDWLANKTEWWCYSDNKTCPPSNYTKWGELVVDFLDAVDCNADTCEVEVWNEPDLQSFWMINSTVALANYKRANAYNKLYNATYLAVKATYPSMSVGAPATTVAVGAELMMFQNFLGNFSNQMDFVSYHQYKQVGEPNYYDLLNNDYLWIVGNCTAKSANCSRILIDELNMEDTYIKSGDEKQWGMEIASAYAVSLNNYPANINLVYYQWSDTDNYTNGNLYEMVSEPKLNNTFYPPYNVTKNFATYHSAGSMVVNSTGSGNIKIVASKKDKQHITLINTGNETNTTLMIFNNASSSFRDLETGEIYDLDEGVIELAIGQYGVKYLESYNPPPETPASEVDGEEEVEGEGDRENASYYNAPVNEESKTNETWENAANAEPSETEEPVESIENETEEPMAKKVTGTGNVILEEDGEVFWKGLLVCLFIGIVIVSFLIWSIGFRRKNKSLSLI